MCNSADGTCVYTPVGSGSPCEDDDPCSATSVCDGAAACVAATPVVCDDPPDDCHAAVGACDPSDGSCDYDLLDAGEPCEDGDMCTQGDACDVDGACQPGPACPTENPCEIGTCEGGACTYTPQSDGTSCGLRPADRCCAGACVDIASDEMNCGGCGLTCVGGHTCETVSNTATCELAPADTSGRCTCNGANAECPDGHVCRTQSPFTNLCTPETAGACPGTFVPVNFCPNYCAY